MAEDGDVEAVKMELRETYKRQLRQLEQRARERVEQRFTIIVHWHAESDLNVIDEDLFDERTWGYLDFRALGSQEWGPRVALRQELAWMRRSVVCRFYWAPQSL